MERPSNSSRVHSSDLADFAPRKKSRRLTKRQQAEKDERHFYDSKIYNLTLDVNNLQQEVRNFENLKLLLSKKKPSSKQSSSGSSSNSSNSPGNSYSPGNADLPKFPPRKKSGRPTKSQKTEKQEREECDSKIYNLALDVHNLKKQIYEYESLKGIYSTHQIHTREQRGPQILSRVKKFFEHFRHGYQEWDVSTRAFLDSCLAPDVQVSTELTGRSAYYDQWRRYKQLFNVSRVETTGFELVSNLEEGAIVRCHGEFEGMVTVEAIAAVFPRIVQKRELMEDIVGAKLICPTRTVLFLNSDGEIIRHDVFTDLLTGFSSILENRLPDVAQILEEIRFVHEGSILPNYESSDTQNGSEEGDTTSSLSSESRSSTSTAQHTVHSDAIITAEGRNREIENIEDGDSEESSRTTSEFDANNDCGRVGIGFLLSK